MNKATACTDEKTGGLLAAYEMGLLSPSERSVFEEHLKGCELCLERLYEMSPYTSAMLAQPAEVAASIAAAEAGQEGKEAPGPEGLRSRTERARGRAWWGYLADWIRAATRMPTPGRVWVPVGVVAAIAVVVLGVFLRPGGGPHDFRGLALLQAAAYVPFETREGAPGEAARLFTQGMQCYADHRYDEAARILAESARAAEQSGGWRGLDQVHLYLGVSLLLSGKAEAALAHLEQASRSPVLPIADRSRWYLAQACLLQNDAYGALRVLEPLAHSSPAYSAQAGRQLEKLRHLMRARGLQAQPDSSAP